MVKETVIGAVGRGLDSWPFKLDTLSPTARHPLRLFFGAVLPRRQAAKMDPATDRYALRYGTANIMKI